VAALSAQKRWNAASQIAQADDNGNIVEYNISLSWLGPFGVASSQSQGKMARSDEGVLLMFILTFGYAETLLLFSVSVAGSN